MSDLVCYKRMPIWQKNTIPEMFTQRHNTKEGTYACLEIFEGELEFVIFEGEQEETEYFNVQKQPPIIQPQVWHKIKWVSDDIKCQLSFLCEPQYLFYYRNGHLKCEAVQLGIFLVVLTEQQLHLVVDSNHDQMP